MSDFPHGPCECRAATCSCGVAPGPAAFVVTRDGKEMKVCTRCDLTSDKPTRRLLVEESDQMDVYRRWDALGAFCIIGLAIERRESKP